jgi:hypothetical protein
MEPQQALAIRVGTKQGTEFLVALRCAFCHSVKPAYGMVKSGAKPFCSPLHATLYSKRKPTGRKAIKLSKVIVGIAVEKIVSSLKLREPASEALPRPPSPHPHQQLTDHQYSQMVDMYKANSLWLDEQFSETLRAGIEAELEPLSGPNAAIAIEGPIRDATLRDKLFFDSDIVRGPADYFVIKEGGRDRLVMRIQLASNPVWIGKVRS